MTVRPPFSVNSFAINSGTIAMQDTKFQKKSFEYNKLIEHPKEETKKNKINIRKKIQSHIKTKCLNNQKDKKSRKFSS